MAHDADKQTSKSTRDDLALALHLADIADQVTMSHYRRADLQVETKSDASPVTEADRACEQALRRHLASERPLDAVLGEEFGTQDAGQAQRVWILDPIDGTKNYLRSVPIWCTLIALAERKDHRLVPTVGVVSAPAMGRRWYAAHGSGAFTVDIDGSHRAIQASSIDDVSDASFSYSDRVGWAERGTAHGLEQLQARTWRSRAYGDFYSHVLVAEGAVDIAAEPMLMLWDMAALIPIVEESGGQFTGFDGSDAMTHLSGLTTNGLLHEQALALIR